MSNPYQYNPNLQSQQNHLQSQNQAVEESERMLNNTLKDHFMLMLSAKGRSIGKSPGEVQGATTGSLKEG